MLRGLVDPDLRPKDLNDDRLGRALKYLSEEKGGRAFAAGVRTTPGDGASGHIRFSQTALRN